MPVLPVGPSSLARTNLAHEHGQAPKILMILLLGASGYVGGALAANLQTRGLPFSAPSHAELDAGSKDALAAVLDALHPDFVINAIGFTGRPNIDGTEFESSYKRGQPAEFAVNGVIKGWTEGLQLLKEGGKAELYVPSNLAYGSRGAGGLIGPDEALVFEVELISVK